MTHSPDLRRETFAVDAIDPETAAFVARLLDIEREAPARTDMALHVERGLTPGAGMLPKQYFCARAEMRTISGPGGDIGLRIIAPLHRPACGVYLHFHGGGFCLGSAAGQDAMLESVADNAGLVAISVDYRLAPEHPFPAALADGEAAAWWIVRHGVAEFGTNRLVLGGESAGANLACVTALRLRERRGFTGLAGLNLSQGGYDLRMTPSMRANVEGPILSRPVLSIHMDRYLGDRDREDWQISPLFADLRGLPPALFTIGTIDPLLDDNMFMYCRWLAAGSHAELAIYPGGIHGFTLTPTELGRRASRRIEAFMAAMCEAKED